ncbi:hypothetical protein [Thiocapsa bogorovii]|uniref:hypothetical protein n=1 Tax=Thiocapsa bogorovii TaxID=521689 RepID=UPI001E29FA48|nr:hypothetical protein [Thiocapsa bogorovii]UHD14769.1 hypothetical protein LT988_15925 [Thiocapsa bogorovii]
MIERVWLILLLLSLAPCSQTLANGESSSESSSERSIQGDQEREAERQDNAVDEQGLTQTTPQWRQGYRGEEFIEFVEVIGEEAPARHNEFFEARAEHRRRARGLPENSRAVRIERRLSSFDEDHGHPETMPDFERLTVGESEGRLAQHLVNIFAAYRQPGDGEFEAQLQNFRELIGQENTTKLSESLEGIRDYMKRLPLSKNNEPTAVQKAQLQSGINSIDALQALIDIRREEKSSRMLPGRSEPVLDQIKTALVKASQRFFENLTGDPVARDLNLNSLKQLGGDNAKVYKLYVDWNTRSVAADQNGRTNAVFKPDGVLNDSDVVTDARIGLTNDATLRQGARQIMTYRLAQELGIGEMVPRTEAFNVAGRNGVIQGEAEGGPAREPRRLNILSRQHVQYADFDRQLKLAEAGDEAAIANVEKAGIYRYRDGRIGVGIDPQNQSDQLGPDFRKAAMRPELWRNLARAEWFDLLCGQVDRNQGNFFITPKGGVQLIDNDQAFGHNRDPFLPRGTLPERPAFIDQELLNRLKALTPERARQISVGLLDTPEQNALVARLEALKEHLETVIEQKGVIGTINRWRSQEVMEHFSTRQHHYNKADPGGEAIPKEV